MTDKKNGAGTAGRVLRSSVQRSQDKVFGNSLTVDRICCLTNSAKDLRNFRLVNRLFQESATKYFRHVHSSVELKSSIDIETFLDCMERREAHQLKPFPFTSFKLDFVELPQELLERFASVVGQHVREYDFFKDNDDFPDDDGSAVSPALENGKKITSLLVHCPLLTTIKLLCLPEIYLTEKDLQRFPTIFSRLQNIITIRCFSRKGKPANPYPFLEVFVQLAPNLKRLLCPSRNPVLSLRILSFLILNRVHKLPNVFFDSGLHFSAADISLGWGKLMEMNFCFRNIAMSIENDRMSDPPGIRQMIHKVEDWLERQARTLSTLGIYVLVRPCLVPLRLPTFPRLSSLTIGFPYSLSFNPIAPNSRPVLPFIENQFPAVQKLCLIRCREDFEVFGDSPLSAVKELKLFDQNVPISNPYWKLIFPNLIKLHIKSARNHVIYGSTLAYILSQFPRLEHLNLELAIVNSMGFLCAKPDCDSWDTLTGNAPRSVNNLTLSNAELAREAGDPPLPVNGVYEVPSLRNMQSLKTLRLYPRHRSNLDAIEYMSRARLLVRLEKLTLSRMQHNLMMTVDELAACEKRLSKFHAKVEICQCSRCNSGCRFKQDCPTCRTKL